MDNTRDAVIVAYGRSPLARAFKGSFSKTHPVEYAAQTLKGVLDKLDGWNPEWIDDVVVGCANPEKYLGYNVGRVIAQRAGLPDSVSAQTVNRFCASGIQAISIGANAIKAGEMDVVVAGGVEMMSGLEMGFSEEYHNKKLKEMNPGAYMPVGLTAENVAERYHISRMRMDQMAVDSHAKAAAARQEGKFNDEIIPIQIETPDGFIAIKTDEGIRPGTSLDKLSTLEPCFKENGTVTAATSSQMTDGAAFVVLMSREMAEKCGYKPIAKFVSYAVGGVAADEMGIGPVVAVPKVLSKTGLTIADMDVIELNEAFAAQAAYCIEKLGVPEDKVNPNGGAMALGHPLGATGAVLTCKALSELKRKNGKYGLVSMCIAGGMGAAGIYELE